MPKRRRVIPGLVGGKRPEPPPPRKPYAVHQLNGLTLVIPPAPPTRNGPPRPGTLDAGGAYRLRLLAGRPEPVGNDHLAYIYAAGPYTVAAIYRDYGASGQPAAYGPYGPDLVIYTPNGGTVKPGRGYYLRGL